MKRNQLMAAVVCALPLLACAQDQKSEIEELRADIARMQVKLDGMETAHSDAGFAGLKISGMIDPTFIASGNRRSAGFNFLNNFDGVDRSGAGQDSTYAFDNSFFGMAMLAFDKETENGTKWHLQLVPHKSASSSMNLGSIIHEATVTIPLEDKNVRMLAGQFADFTGYEYFLAHQTKLVTHNLLFDFTQPSYYVGAGVEAVVDAWTTKVLVANMNKSSQSDREHDPIVVFRTDYLHSEFSGVGVTGQFGKYLGQRLTMLSSDAFYTRGAVSLNGQINVGQWRNKAFNGGDARWAGTSLQAAYKVTPRLELVARGDYLKNDKNGGGTIATVFSDDGGDYRNGLGPSPEALAVADAGGTLRGANRSALTLGGNYAYNENVVFKFEGRYDHASQNVFLKPGDNQYRNNNTLLAASVVATF
ncbi:DUF3138 family protein [Duganella sp. FT80W]|uniref:DUF3138 family protein n=1 Tax=Duganella guangzhouensis TaxID=2666084 RepID=A0A6I2L3Q7_9BURK|nr:DUF3138 family protein [Duganella guangzhouensis]MRW91787.1 DUF3138 family protein [Duganella guangzhouensis]